MSPSVVGSAMTQASWTTASSISHVGDGSFQGGGQSKSSRRGPGSAKDRRDRKKRTEERNRQEKQQVQQQAGEDRMAWLAGRYTQYLEAGGENCTEALAKLQSPGCEQYWARSPAGDWEFQRTVETPGLVLDFAFHKKGCRVVQLALDVADRRVAAELAARLRGAVVAAIESPHANYVIQKIIKVLSLQEAPFIVDELRNLGLALACHEFGCRVFCRFLEHWAGDESIIQLVDSILPATGDLIIHEYGHHVVEFVLKHGSPHHKSRIFVELRKDPLRKALVRSVAYVIEKALLLGSKEDQQALISDFMAASEDEMAALAKSQYGCMVLRALLRSPRTCMQPSSTFLQLKLMSSSVMPYLQSTKHGRRVSSMLTCMEDGRHADGSS